MDLNRFLAGELKLGETIRGGALDEGLLDFAKKWFSKIAVYFKTRYNAIKATLVKVGGRNFVLLDGKDGSRGACLRGRKVLDTGHFGYGGQKNNFHVISVMGGVKIAPSAGAQSESLFSKMSSEIAEAAKKSGGKDLDWMQNPEIKVPARKRSGALDPDAILFADVLGYGATLQNAKSFFSGKQEFGEIARNIGEIDDIPEVVYSSKMGDENIISASDLKELLNDLAFQVGFRTNYDQFVPSICVFGAPGQGKTYIAREMADEFGMHFQSIEVGAIYEEVFGGMPLTGTRIWLVNDKTGEKQDVTSQFAALARAPSDSKLKPLASESVAGKTWTPDGRAVEAGPDGPIVGDRRRMEHARVRYGLVQQHLAGTLAINESNSTMLDIQAAELRKRLTGEPVPMRLRETVEWDHYRGMLNEAETPEGYHIKQEKYVMLSALEGVLPPHKDKEPWLLLLDEFNQDAVKMKLVMNLLLSGSIGTIYFLPLKTVVAVAGNMGGGFDQGGDNETVAQLTTAVLTRFNYIVRLAVTSHDVSAHIMDVKRGDDKETTGKESGEKKYTTAADFSQDPKNLKAFRQMTAPTAWMNYATAYKAANQTALEQQRNPIQLVHFQPQGDQVVPLNSRFIQIIGDNVKLNTLRDWNKGDLVGDRDAKGKLLQDKAWYEKNYKTFNIPQYDVENKEWVDKTAKSPIDMYLQVNQLHPRYLAVINNSLMKAGKTSLQELLRAFLQTGLQFKLGSTKHILLNHALKWLQVDQIDDSKKKQEATDKLTKVAADGLNVIASQLPKTLYSLGDKKGAEAEADKIEAEAEDKTAPKWKDYETFEGNVCMLIATNIIAFLNSANAPEDVLTDLGNRLCMSMHSKEVADDEKKNAFWREIIRFLNSDRRFKTMFKMLDGLKGSEEFLGGGQGDDAEADMNAESLFLSLRGALLNEKSGPVDVSKIFKSNTATLLNKKMNEYWGKKMQALYHSSYRAKMNAIIDKLINDGSRDILDITVEVLQTASKLGIWNEVVKTGAETSVGKPEEKRGLMARASARR